MQGLLIQVRRDAVGSNRTPLLDSMQVNIAAADIDQLAATLQHKVSRGRMYLTKESGALALVCISPLRLRNPCPTITFKPSRNHIG